MARHHRGQGGKVLTLAFAPGDQHQAAVLSQALQGGHRGTHIGAFAVVDVFHVLHHGHGAGTVGLAPVFAQGIQHGPQGGLGVAGQGQCGQSIEGIVLAADAQGLGRHQALHERRIVVIALVLGRTGAGLFAPTFALDQAHQPHHAVHNFQTPVTGHTGGVAAKGGDLSLDGFFLFRGIADRLQSHHARIIAVEHQQAGAAHDAGLGGAVIIHAAVPIEVVFAQVEHGAGTGLKILDPIELKARQLQHPDRWQARTCGALAPGVEQIGANVARHDHVLTRGLKQPGGQGRDRGFAIGAGDGQHLRCIARLGLGLAQRVDKQTQFGAHPQACFNRCTPHRRHFGRGQARAFEHRADALRGQQAGVECASDELRLRCMGVQIGQAWWLSAGVHHPHPSALLAAPARHGQARLAQAQHQHGLVLQGGGVRGVHRSFKVDRPIRHSSMVMIQKRTTTWVSFQPDFSKW